MLLPNFVELFEAWDQPVKLTMPAKEKELYLGEVEDFEEELGSLEVDLDKERALLVERLADNFWLTRKDREEVLAQYDAKTRYHEPR